VGPNPATPTFSRAGKVVGWFDLRQRFAAVSDGCSDQGRDHPVAVVLTLCAAAVLAGMRSSTGIAGWVGRCACRAAGPAVRPSRRASVEDNDLAGTQPEPTPAPWTP
jgi:hypothetical protein